MTGPIDHREEYELASAAAQQLESAGFGDAVAVVQTGSGIAPPALTDRTSLPWSDIAGFPRATAPGHRGVLHHGRWGGVPVLVLQGRLHLYEGHAPAHVVRPIRALGLLGVPNVILTNATGGVRVGLDAGAVVRIADHVNLLGCDPLAGLHEPRFGERFPVTAGRAHDAHLGRLAHAAAEEAGVPLTDGVYGAVHGPSFETPAEVRRLRLLGVDVCGMSTVPEVLAANQMDRAVLVLSLVANPAGVVADGVSAETEVLETGAAHGARLMRIVEGVVARLGAEVQA